MWSGWRSRACLRSGLLEPEALERHIQVAQVEGRVEELRQLVGGEPLAHLRGLPDDQLEVLSPIERAERRPLHDPVGILPGHTLLNQRQEDALREHNAAAAVEIGAHALAV